MASYGTLSLPNRPAGSKMRRNALTIAGAVAGVCAFAAVAFSFHPADSRSSGLLQVVPTFFLAGRTLFVHSRHSLATYPYYWVNPWNNDYYSGIANGESYLNDRYYNMGAYAATTNFNKQQYAEMSGYNGESFANNNQYNGDSFANNNAFDKGALENNIAFDKGHLDNNNAFNKGVQSNNNDYNKGVYSNDADFNQGAYDANDAFNKGKKGKKGTQKGKKDPKKSKKIRMHQLALDAKQAQWLSSRPDLDNKNSPTDGWLDYNPDSLHWGYDHHLNKNPTGGEPVRILVEHDPKGGADLVGDAQAPFHPKKVDIEVPESFQVDEYPRSVSGTHFK
mmetsp:Transcript_37393/g.88415  ORF Transcript_37393/g.88415 Transcript_37393/m.88415 type:complete len:335 (+) Transcript_37393:28-1032(+)